jgi:hypothetical protein
MSAENLELLRKITQARMKDESEKVFDYDINDYDNWTEKWWPEPEESDTRECHACFGTGTDKYEDAYCLVCYGEGVV